MNTSLMVPARRRSRRRHSAEFKSSVISACLQPGVSIAGVALANGLNANMLRKWVTEAEREPLLHPESPVAAAGTPEPASPSFVQLGGASSMPPPSVRVEVERAGTKIRIDWPVAAAAECGAWLHGLLK